MIYSCLIGSSYVARCHLESCRLTSCTRLPNWKSASSRVRCSCRSSRGSASAPNRNFTQYTSTLFARCSLKSTLKLTLNPRRASNQRSVGSTKLNSHSSRSHAILSLHIDIVDPASGKSRWNSQPYITVVLTALTALTGTVNLVDLAGSENNKVWRCD